jgi:hypothetical protein
MGDTVYVYDLEDLNEEVAAEARRIMADRFFRGNDFRGLKANWFDDLVKDGDIHRARVRSQALEELTEQRLNQ